MKIEYTPEQLENANRYMLCRVCGQPREAKMETKDGVPTFSIVCPNGHPQE